MKKILITLLVICYSCTLFSQNSMNVIKKLEQKIDSVDNLINQLDSINYPVPQDKLNLLKSQRKIAHQKYTAQKYTEPKEYYTYEKKNFAQGLGITTMIVGPLLGTAIVVSKENGTIDYFKKDNNYLSAAVTCFSVVPIIGTIPIIVSNKRYRESKVKRNNYNFEIEAKKCELDQLDNQIKAEEDRLRKLRTNKYKIRKSELKEERDNLVDKLTETLKDNNLITYDTITTTIDSVYYDYNSGYLYSHNQIPEKYFLIDLDTTRVNYSPIYGKYFQSCYIKIVKNIKLKKGRYFYTTTDTLQNSKVNKFGNYYYINIPVKFEYNINYNGKEYEITMKAFKNNKLIDISYFNRISKLREIEIGINILKGKYSRDVNIRENNTYDTYVGPRGGRYYINKNGNKTYIKRK